MYSLKNPKLIKLLAAAALFTSISAIAGTKDGGGGGAYVCRDADGKVVSARLADLWESQNTPFRWPNGARKLDIPLTQEEPQAQFDRAVAKLRAVEPRLANAVVAEMRIWGNKNSLPEDVSIAVPQDLKVGYFPTGCPAEGMMFFNGESDQLDVREELFAAMKTKTEIAAAWMHEALYKVLRDQFLHNESKYARRLVACLFSTDTACLVEAAPVIPSDRPVWQCKNDVMDTIVFPGSHIDDPKELLKPGSPSLRVVYRRVGDLGLQYETKQDYIRGPVDGAFYSPYPGSPLGLSAFKTMRYLSVVPIQPNKETGEIGSIKLHSYSRTAAYDESTPDYVIVNREIPCKRIH